MVLKSRHKADLDQAQREYWWHKTPEERLAAGVRLNRLARQLYAANPDNPPPTYQTNGTRILKSATPIPRAQR